MKLPDVEVIGLQPAQAALDRLDDVPPRGAARIDVRSGGVEALGDHHQIVAVAAHQRAEDLLGLALGVLVGSVEEVDARVAAGLEHGGGSRFVGVAAEGHGAVAEFGNFDAGAAE